MKKSMLLLGGIAVFVLFVGVTGSQAVCAAAPYLAKCGAGTATYYIRDLSLDADGNLAGGSRFVVERQDIFQSWGLVAEQVNSHSSSALAELPLAGVLTYAPGTLLQVNNHWDVFVVTRGRVLRPLDTERTALKHFGSDWKKKIKQIPASWMQQYVIGGMVINETWFSDRELEASEVTLKDATELNWRAQVAVIRDQERLETIQGTLIPFLYDIIKVQGHSSPTVHGKWLLGTRGAGWVYATDTLNRRFRRVPTSSCNGLTAGKCIDPAPDAQINTDICGTQAPYGYASHGGFEISFCIESEGAQWMPRTDDFDTNNAIQNLRPGWYKYTPQGLDRISP